MNFDHSKLNQQALDALKAVGLGDTVLEIEKDREDKRNKYLKLFITQDQDMLNMKLEVEKLIDVDYPVLIRGETGTGKELIARALHGERKGEFMAINCAGLPSELIESELFGHVAGAFTGAKQQKVGLMRRAENGTIFLDEIGELPYDVQAKFLRVLQEKKVRMVGGEGEIPINCRIISATHKALTEDKFRADLFHRISTFELETSALRFRPLDVPLILKSLDVENKIANVEDFAIHLLEIDINGVPQRLSGNVRSLQKAVLRYYVLGKMPI